MNTKQYLRFILSVLRYFCVEKNKYFFFSFLGRTNGSESKNENDGRRGRREAKKEQNLYSVRQP